MPLRLPGSANKSRQTRVLTRMFRNRLEVHLFGTYGLGLAAEREGTLATSAHPDRSSTVVVVSRERPAMRGHSDACRQSENAELGVKMPQSVKLVSIATAVPPYLLKQRDAAIAAHRGFAGRYDDFERLARVFKSSGIRERYAVRPIEWYFEPLGWPERTKAYLDGACQLFVEAATKALDASGIGAADVDTVVTISSTGVATPSLEARAAVRIGFRDNVERVPVFGLGCAGGVSGFSIASRLAHSRPGSVVLLVAVEVCTLAFRLDELTKANIVATALFGDGAAACVLRADEAGIAAVEMGVNIPGPILSISWVGMSTRKGSKLFSTGPFHRSPSNI
jgi:3-oxoacyl-[acyl-carrier-protein] synthase III